MMKQRTQLPALPVCDELSVTFADRAESGQVIVTRSVLLQFNSSEPDVDQETMHHGSGSIINRSLPTSTGSSHVIRIAGQLSLSLRRLTRPQMTRHFVWCRISGGYALNRMIL